MGRSWWSPGHGLSGNGCGVGADADGGRLAGKGKSLRGNLMKFSSLFDDSSTCWNHLALRARSTSRGSPNCGVRRAREWAGRCWTLDSGQGNQAERDANGGNTRVSPVSGGGSPPVSLPVKPPFVLTWPPASLPVKQASLYAQAWTTHLPPPLLPACTDSLIDARRIASHPTAVARQ